MDIPSPLRLLLRCMDRAVVWRLSVGCVLAAAGGLFAGLGPAALRGIVDAALPGKGHHRNSADAVLFGGAYLLCLCVNRLIGELRPALSGVGEQRLYSALRLQFMRHALALPLGFHLAQRSGTMSHALQQAVTGCQVVLQSASNGIAPVIVEGITVAVVLTSLHQPALSMIFAATAASYLAVTVSRTAALRTSAHAVSAASALANSTLSDGLTNIEAIKCFAAEQSTTSRYAAGLAQTEAAWRQLLHQRLNTGLATTAIFALFMGTALAFAVMGVRDGSLTVGGFVLVNVYLAQMVRPLELLAAGARDLSTGMAFMRPLVEILKEPGETTTVDQGPPLGDRPEGKKPLEHPACGGIDRPRRRSPPSVRFQGVRLAFVPGRPVLEDLTLEVGAGKSMGIVGASGCGKSSLLRLLLRLLSPQSGEVLLDELSINDLPLATLRTNIAVVPQDTVLLNSTIAANIALGDALASAADIETAARLAGLHDFVAGLHLGYDTEIGERGLKLSGGERQRIAIARALLREPQVLLLDEATSMLDSATEAAILSNLEAITTGRTSIVVAHRLSAVRDLDEIAVIAGGRVAEQGNHAALLALNGLYASMWRRQASGRAI